MKVSAFTFIKNGELLGYPFIESIKSILPIVDEFIVNYGESEDNTLELLKKIRSSKIQIIKSRWNENMRDRGFVYGQQKMIGQYNCSGDWAFYIEGDEVYHEADLKKIRECMLEYKDDNDVEALVFNFYHFYGNKNTFLNSPGWYRSEARIIKNTIRTYAPDGLFWLVLDNNKKARYPRAKHTGVSCYHYGWVRSEQKMQAKVDKVSKYWGVEFHRSVDYSQIDDSILEEFTGDHPQIMKDWLPDSPGRFIPDKNYKLTMKQKKHRVMIKVENFFGLDLSKKHFKLL